MTWFKVDDSFYDHPKIFDAPDCAVALWTRAGSWSARNLTDGFVPAGMPARLCDDHDTAVRELVDRGLWRRTRGGFRFHDWTSYQPSAQKVRELREKRVESGRKGGLTRASNRSKQASKSQASAWPVAKQNPTPTRPVKDASNEASSSRARTRATRIPDDFRPSPDMLAWARQRAPDLDIDVETEKFANYWSAKAGQSATKLDWAATWRNWMLNAEQRTPIRNGHRATTDERVAQAQALKARFRPDLTALPGGSP